MNGFIPLGYRTLRDAAGSLGVEALGAALAAGVLKAWTLSASGIVTPMDAVIWRADDARRLMEAGRTWDHKGRPDALILVAIDDDFRAAERALTETPTPVGSFTAPAWWPRPGQSLASWCVSLPAEDEVRRRIRAQGGTFSDEATSIALTEMWTEAGGSTNADTIGRTRRRERARPK